MTELEHQLKIELVKNIWAVIFSTGVLGIFKKGSKEAIINSIQFDDRDLKEIDKFDDYDYWHFVNLKEIHKKLLPLYREDLNIDPENPYTYTAKIFNQFIKLYWLQIVNLYPDDFGKHCTMIHPIFSNKFIKHIVNDNATINFFNEEEYYNHVLYYRSYLKDPLFHELSIQTIALIEGIDI